MKIPKTRISATGFRRNHSSRARYSASAIATVAELVGDLQPGDDFTGMTSGQFSLLDIIEHCARILGPCDMRISTWTAGIYDIDRANAFLTGGNFTDVRWLVDPQIFSSMPENAGVLIEYFGEKSFRFCKTHAKVVVLSAGGTGIVIRSSMNLNKNLRIENFDISYSPDMTAFFIEWFDGVWDAIIEGNRRETAEMLASIFQKYDDGRKRRSSHLPDAKAMARKLPHHTTIGVGK